VCVPGVTSACEGMSQQVTLGKKQICSASKKSEVLKCVSIQEIILRYCSYYLTTTSYVNHLWGRRQIK